ncbi:MULTISPECIES: hypothetical protein [Methylosinus]|uniref:Site-2 protease family protein n=1 Tax=Methylosinus trichosporium (strain ATCC 35070 / NCIMB 11131 / UNIQEM 75 / OB3b) TaxID=595536 RepID=A0A2D2D2E2_METT3|nr:MULTISPECIES: hypothetical protein [Methylosinus]ATQ69163.1 hypothetical protein CQW49_15700 [Methylosinus trichosporium OB3b]OBS53587.1 hypothetical protein A8B73_05150 [Methylosinus sp. 3S-1]
MISASEFFEGATGETLVWALGIAAICWIVFHAPRGRRMFRHRLSICAPAEKIWSALTLEPSPPDGWGGAAQVESQSFVEGPPIRHEAVVGVSGRAGPTRTTLSRILHIDHAKRLESQCELLDGVAATPAQATRVSLRLEEEKGLTRIEHEISREVRGLLGHWSLSRFYDRYWDHIRAHCEGASPPPMSFPMRRTAAWLAVAAVVAGGVALGRAENAETGSGLVMLFALLQLAIILHELGHFLAMRMFGHGDARMTLLPFFGVATLGARRASSRYERAMSALCGPGLSALAALALTPLAQWGLDAIPVDCGGLSAETDDDPISTVRDCAPVIAVLMIFYNLVQLAPVGSLDGAAIVGALARSRATRALLGAALLSGVGVASAIAGSATFAGAVAAVAAVTWAYAMLTPDTLDRRSEPMSSGQLAVTFAALLLTIAAYVVASRALLPEFVNKIMQQQRCDHAPATSDDGPPSLYPVRDTRVMAP